MAIIEVDSVPGSRVERIELRHKHRASALTQLVTAAAARGIVHESAALLETFARLERLAPSAIGKQVALPHARSFCIDRPEVVLGRSARGIAWDAPDGEPVRLVLMVLSPAGLSAESHLERVAAFAQLVRQQRTRQRLLEGAEAAARAVFAAADAR